MTSPISPSLAVTNKVGPQLAALGATVKNDVATSGVTVSFADPVDAQVARTAFEDTIGGVKVLYTDATGAVPGERATFSQVLNGISKLPGLKDVTVAESFPAEVTIIAKHESVNALNALLRDETVGEGHWITVVDEGAACDFGNPG